MRPRAMDAQVEPREALDNVYAFGHYGDTAADSECDIGAVALW